jgi:ribulose-phosphate 3-epimerase
VPNISFGPMLVNFFRKATEKICDVHLMIVNPEKYTEAFHKAGADILTVHIEACIHLHRNIQQIKAMGMQAGVAINPHTPVNSLIEIIEEVDLVCVMSVNPGFGGQSFIPQTLSKITELKKLILDKNPSVKIEVDGGVTLQNAGAIIAAGADVLVAGNTVFNSSDPTATISALKRL